MTNVVRVALDRYNALTDTNPDHFSLYSDIDNVLIKTKAKGNATLAAASGPPGYAQFSYNHALGYIPFFASHAKGLFGISDWSLINNTYNLIQVPEAISAVDNSNLYIINFLISDLPYSYDLFYDDMTISGVTPSIVESEQVFKVARPNKSANSLNPNDYIMHSDLNNFKILKQETLTGQTINGSAVNFFGVTNFAHGLTLTEPYKAFVFIKFPDGKTTLCGGLSFPPPTQSYDEANTLVAASINATNIIIRIHKTTNIIADITYIIYGSGANNTVDNSGMILACAKLGKNVLTATNPDDFYYHSKYPTLKYFIEGTYSMTVSDETVHTIPHNLGYVPVHFGFVKDFSAYTETFYGNNPAYALAPFYLTRSTFGTPNNDIGAFVYADDTNLYLKAYYQPNAVGTSYTFDFYYKIFKNNLNL